LVVVSLPTKSAEFAGGVVVPDPKKIPLTTAFGRRLPGAPHETLLVLDGTVGQNAIQQGRLFTQAVSPTGIVVTKLDGSARGGAVTALRRELGLPIRFIGVGESLDDLQPFDSRRFAEHLLAGSA
jgi:fused signal recognition particle receptor